MGKRIADRAVESVDNVASEAVKSRDRRRFGEESDFGLVDRGIER